MSSKDLLELIENNDENDIEKMFNKEFSNKIMERLQVYREQIAKKLFEQIINQDK
jgi:hypothetical protein